MGNKKVVRYMELAETISKWSKDPSTKIGAIAVSDRGRVLATGFNGFPRGIADTPERYNDRETKLKYVVHAEANMIYNATASGVDLYDSEVYVYGLPICSECAKALIQVGVKRVYVVNEHVNKSERWIESWNLTKSMFDECGLEIVYV